MEKSQLCVVTMEKSQLRVIVSQLISTLTTRSQPSPYLLITTSAHDLVEVFILSIFLLGLIEKNHIQNTNEAEYKNQIKKAKA